MTAGPERTRLPAWSLPAGAAPQIDVRIAWPRSTTGKDVRVCVLDSGIDGSHPLVGGIDRAVAVRKLDDDTLEVVDDDEGDPTGHGTACAGIIRGLAPECSLISVRVLGAGYTGSGPMLLRGLRWAVEEGFDVINMSLSTTKSQFAGVLHELADAAYFRRTVLVASAHNMPVESYPWKFSSVISVGSHEDRDPLAFYANPDPPVEFFARGVDVELAWAGGATIRATGNSFATPHLSAICALILGKHPELTPFQLKSVLYLTASNVGGEP